MKYRATVSLCIIVKNEEKFIDKCLSSASDVVNEIIIVDTGSTDDTIKIAEGYNAQIYHFTWNDSFSDARNFSISKARFDWILLLDADEMLDAGDKTKFLDYINTTKSDGCHFLTYNYIGEIGQGSYSLHNAFRLLRNNRRYRFEGAIHEQIRRIDGKDIEPGTFDVQDIHIHHYGYLDEVVREKNKRERNVPIITRLLERDPNNSFMLFNLGNEYMASGKYTEALEQYDKAYGSMDTTQAYAPHLIYRRAMCMYTLRQFQATIHTLAEGLAKYPACTDFEYLRGTVYTEWGRYTLAIDSFEKCIRMGEPHSSLKFIDFCATTRPLISLGQVYHRLEDYDRAIDCYTKAFNLDNTNRQILYILGELLNARYEEKGVVEEKLWGYLTAKDHIPNLVVMSDIMLKLGLLDYARKHLDTACNMEGYETDKTFLRAKLYFNNGVYNKAYEQFIVILEASENSSTILLGIPQESAMHLFIAAMLTATEKLKVALEQVEKHCDDITARVYRQMALIYSNNENSDSDVNIGPDKLAFPVISSLLDKVLRSRDYILFEKLLKIYNCMDSKAVLINLAEIYYQNGLYKMASTQVLRSIRDLEYLDPLGIEILWKTKNII